MHGLQLLDQDVEILLPVGGRVLRIGNVSAEEAYARIEPLVPVDNEWTLRDRTPRTLTFANLLAGTGILDDTDACPIEVETDDGRRVRAVIPCSPHHDESGWPTALQAAGTSPPLYLQQPERSYFFTPLPEHDAVYLLFRAVRNDEAEPFADFCTRAFAYLEEHDVDRLIVDLRLNGGGNNFLNRPLIHGIIRNEKVNREGNLFVITGRRTFSAAMCGTIDLERQTNALFVGEPTGASPNHHGDAVAITLPHTGLVVNISSLYWQNSDPRDMRPWLEPDVPAELTWPDYAAGRDPALEAALNYAGDKREHVGRVVDGWLAEGMSVADAITRYRTLRDSDERANYHFGEFELNRIGYGLLEHGMTEEALAIFRLNTEEFPRSWNPWDSYGEALAAAGRTDEAIAAYARSVALNPSNRGGQAALRRLRREMEETG
ncbi:tetratricopeptide repeat protein [bacterium]|nr:tetratricopeptide repeat protein [bacterium]